MKKLLGLFLLTLCCYTCSAQVFTTVTGTLTDSGGTVWANAHIIVTIMAPFGNPNKLNNQGHDINSPVDFFADNTGSFNISLDDNSVILPSGSTWKFTLCPNATVKVCSESIQVVHGVSMNLSSSLSADLQVPQVNAAPTLYRAYNDNQVTGGQGALYWRVTDNTIRGYNGTTWVPVGGGGGGSQPTKWSDIISPTANLILSMNNFTTQFNMGTTGSTGSAFNITDSNTNNGTNYLFGINTGTTSTAKPFVMCVNGTNDCIEYNASKVMQALGAAQLIATQVFNTGPGVGITQLGSNGTGSVSQTNTIKLTGNNNKAYISENAGTLSKVLLGGQVSCAGNTTLKSIDVDGIDTCLDSSLAIYSANGIFTGTNVMAILRGITIQEETGSNNDTFGSLAFTGGTTSATYTFGTGTAHICVISPISDLSTNRIWISNEGTALQFTSNAALTATVNYFCGGYATY
jgi:hypothetical protein